MQDQLTPPNPIGVFISAFALSSFAGLAALLRGGAKLTWVSVIAAMLNSGLLGTVIVMIWYTQFVDNIFCLLGGAILCGMGGMTAVDFIITAIKKSGLNVTFSKDSGFKIGEKESDAK